MSALSFRPETGVVITLQVDVDDWIELDVERRDRIFEIVDHLKAFFGDAPKDVPLSATPEEKPEIGDTKPAPASASERQLTVHLNGQRVQWDKQVPLLFDGRADRIVREVDGAAGAASQKHFLQNKFPTIRVDVTMIDGKHRIEVRRREPGE